jgi:AAA family ATP:ADP antiporter
VKTLPRTRFITITYRFFAANILLFAIALHFADAEQTIWIGRAFCIWISIFNLFVVSVFWALIVDTFNSEQGKRLFGFIAAGATIGAITGSTITATFARHVPTPLMLVGAIILIEVAVFSVRHLSRLSEALNARPNESPGSPVGGNRIRRYYASLQVGLSGQCQPFHPAVRDHRDVPLLPAGKPGARQFS